MKAILIVEYDDDFNIDDLMVDYTLFHNEKNVYRMFNETLIPMPQKMEEEDGYTKFDGDYYEQVRGYNACINEILGEEE